MGSSLEELAEQIIGGQGQELGGGGGGTSPPRPTPTRPGANGPSISGAALGGLGRLLPRALTGGMRPARPTAPAPSLPTPSPDAGSGSAIDTREAKESDAGRRSKKSRRSGARHRSNRTKSPIGDVSGEGGNIAEATWEEKKLEVLSEDEPPEPVKPPQPRKVKAGSQSESETASSESSEDIEYHNHKRAGGWKRLAAEGRPSMQKYDRDTDTKMGHRWGKTQQPDDRPEVPNASMAYTHENENQVYMGRTPGLDKSIGERTKYYDKDEREAHRVNVNESGLLTGADGKLMDTKGSGAHIRVGSAEGRHLFAMDNAGGVFAADSKAENDASLAAAKSAATGDGPKPSHVDHIHHSSFFEGDAVNPETGNWERKRSAGVKGAGELEVKEGWLKNVSNNSGHYTPDNKQLASTIQTLQDQGVNTDASKADYVHQRLSEDGSKTETAKTEYMARAFAASGGDTKLLDAQKSTFAAIGGGQAPKLKRVHSPGRATRAHNRSKPGGRSTPGQKRAAALAGEAPGLGQAAGFTGGPDRFAGLERGVPEWAKAEKKAKTPEPEPEESSSEESGSWSSEDGSGSSEDGSGSSEEGSRDGGGKAHVEPIVVNGGDASSEGGNHDANMGGGPAHYNMGGGLAHYNAIGNAFAEHMSISSSSSEDDDGDNPKRLKRAGGWERKPLADDLDRKDGDARTWTPTTEPDGTFNNKGNQMPEAAFVNPKVGGGNGAGAFANEQEDHFGVRPPDLDPSIGVRTKYYNDDEREAHRLTVNTGNGDLREARRSLGRGERGLLKGADGKLLDTSGAAAHGVTGAQGGRHIFALDANANLYSADSHAENAASTTAARKATGDDRHVDFVHHSTFTEGRANDADGKWQEGQSKGVMGAGELEAKQGWLKTISNNSGHYMPGKDSLAKTVGAMQNMGVNTDATKVDYVTEEKNGKIASRSYMANAFAASEGNTRLLDAQASSMLAIRSGLGASLLKPASERKQPTGALLGGLGLGGPEMRAEGTAGDSGE